MFRNRKNRLKPSAELYAAFKHAFPHVGPGSSKPWSPESAAATISSSDNTPLLQTSRRSLDSALNNTLTPKATQVLFKSRHEPSSLCRPSSAGTVVADGGAKGETRDDERLASADDLSSSWRFTPSFFGGADSLVLPDDLAASQQGPHTLGGLDDLAMSGMNGPSFHFQAGDLHTPGMSFGVGFGNSWTATAGESRHSNREQDNIKTTMAGLDSVKDADGQDEHLQSRLQEPKNDQYENHQTVHPHDLNKPPSPQLSQLSHHSHQPQQPRQPPIAPSADPSASNTHPVETYSSYNQASTVFAQNWQQPISKPRVEQQRCFVNNIPPASPSQAQVRSAQNPKPMCLDTHRDPGPALVMKPSAAFSNLAAFSNPAFGQFSTNTFAQPSHQVFDRDHKLRYHVTLSAPTAMVQCAEEIPLTYLNKGQAYRLSIQDTHNHGPFQGPVKYRTVIRISFEEEEQRQKPSSCWQLWKEGRGLAESHHRAGRLQAVEYVGPTDNEAEDGKDQRRARTRVDVEMASFDSFAVSWSPLSNSTTASCTFGVRFNFLSTDFSHSKGVKGIPVRLCAKTEIVASSTPDSPPQTQTQAQAHPKFEVSFCKVKLFRDHGAERKLSNDISHLRKLIDKLKHQISQTVACSRERESNTKRKLKDSFSQPQTAQTGQTGPAYPDQIGDRPSKARKQSRTDTAITAMHTLDEADFNLPTATSDRPCDAAEESLMERLRSLEAMFDSTKPFSVLNLKGDKGDDPDLYPVILPGESLMNTSKQAMLRQKESWDSPLISDEGTSKTSAISPTLTGRSDSQRMSSEQDMCAIVGTSDFSSEYSSEYSAQHQNQHQFMQVNPPAANTRWNEIDPLHIDSSYRTGIGTGSGMGIGTKGNPMSAITFSVQSGQAGSLRQVHQQQIDDPALMSMRDWTDMFGVGVDTTYHAPPDRVQKPVACFYVLANQAPPARDSRCGKGCSDSNSSRNGNGNGEDSSDTISQSQHAGGASHSLHHQASNRSTTTSSATNTTNTNSFYKAIYLMHYTAKELLRVLAAKCEVDPSQVRHMIRINPRGLKIMVDDDMVREIPEGQDMLVEWREVIDDVEEDCEHLTKSSSIQQSAQQSNSGPRTTSSPSETLSHEGRDGFRRTVDREQSTSVPKFEMRLLF